MHIAAAKWWPRITRRICFAIHPRANTYGRVVVTVREPTVYLARLGRLARLAGAVNVRWFGSPVTVGSVGLQTTFANLSKLLHEGFERYHLRGPET